MAAGAPGSGAGAGGGPELSAFQRAVRAALEAAARDRGWSTERIHEGDTFCRMVIRGDDGGVLVDRAAARDFADVYVLALRFGKHALLACAARIDAGFDAKVLADMFATLDRFTDSEIPVPDGLSVDELRTFYATWRSQLSAQT